MFCPRCRAPMRAQPMAGREGQVLSIDICPPCHSIWFDSFESSSLSPSSTLTLFRIIGAYAKAPGRARAGWGQCPRCGARMTPGSDFSRGARFDFLECPANHGRFVSFYNFLRQREFLRPMTRAEFEVLRAHTARLPCSNCGSPIDLGAHTACQYCSAVLSTLDLATAGRLIAQLQQAARERRGIDPALAEDLEALREDAQTTFDGFTPSDQWYEDAAATGLVGAGALAVARWLGRRA